MTISCKNKKEKLVESSIQLGESTLTEPEIKEKTDTIKVENGLNEVMQESDILFNGKLKRYFTLDEFERVFGKADSIKLMSEEAPCSYIFENEDGSKDMDDKYLYKNGSQFENTKNKVAVDEFRFTENNFILFKGKKLNSSTDIKELKKTFPNAIKNIGTMDVFGEGNLQVIELREDENNISDGHINLFLKNGKLYYMHWWFPC
jgi:hypothetical protein